MKRILPFVVLAGLLAVATSVLAGPEGRPEPAPGPGRGARTSASYDQSWHVMGSAGAPASSASFAASGTLSQLAVGTSEGDTYRAEHGYWHGTPFEAHLPVGGLVVPVSKLGLLAPWAGAAVLIAVTAGAWLIWRSGRND
jgi:hypothetical protein